MVQKEVWTLSETAEKMLNAFERKVLRKIYGPLLVNGQLQNKYNHEIHKLYKEMELTRNIRLRKLQWMGHVMMKNERVLKRALKGNTEGRRPVGRSRGRWLDSGDRDKKRLLKCRNWRRSAEDTGAWRGRYKEDIAQVAVAENNNNNNNNNNVCVHLCPELCNCASVTVKAVHHKSSCDDDY